MKLGRYSVGVGDRFGREGKAQLDAMIMSQKRGIEITPVWNKSNREHVIVGTTPADVRKEADAAIKARRWQGAYFVDADHINLTNVEKFIDSCDFFTIDVADFIGKPVDTGVLSKFSASRKELSGSIPLEGIDRPQVVTSEEIEAGARKFLAAVKEAGRIYRHIESRKGKGAFVVEVSMDESAEPQSPVELLVILAAIADEGIPVQTIAPKFSGRFNKGVDYAGTVTKFASEFCEDIAVLRFAVAEFGLPADLKLSVHSGSDKFSIYASIRDALQRFDAGVHLKTAGTTWLEEVTGLAVSGGEGLEIAREIYSQAFARFDELCGPYATVIDIERTHLPAPGTVAGWTGDRFAAALRHVSICPDYNPSFRQLVHVSYKIAAEMGSRYLDALDSNSDIVSENVTLNLYARHLLPVFG